MRQTFLSSANFLAAGVAKTRSPLGGELAGDGEDFLGAGFEASSFAGAGGGGADSSFFAGGGDDPPPLETL